MKIPGQQIARFLERIEKKEIRKLNKEKRKKLTLAVVLVGNSPEQLSFVKIKKKLAKKLAIKFDLIHLKRTPSFEKFMHLVKEKAVDAKTGGIIIQQPLPSQLQTDCLYDFLPLDKEIEGHHRKTSFLPPIGLATITLLKYVFANGKIDSHLLVDPKADRTLMKRALRNKKVVLLGRGFTGGRPVGKTLSYFGINFINVNSATPNPTEYLKQADIIISAVGKKVISPEMLKPGVVLINVGLRREGNQLKGDYEEKEIQKIASYYTPTPGGIGPLDSLYLYHNLIQAVKLQK
ncbi:MAG: bifunctional 5,10-methylenetetrahydrofolate dehydrogenase/5,10-methenyltetrahydrofolate cyclohydrolase [Microgenomates group bacterium]|nr:bifunctional 5,10-methylenetetrahydrofolate dehydrogenase/5,10-methenyltetrahydrofolate cyclohydrolase [Microgenomates group bacterium]